MLSRELEQSLNLAIQKARENRHEYITVEHLLYALLDNPPAIQAIQACGGVLKDCVMSLIISLKDFKYIY